MGDRLTPMSASTKSGSPQTSSPGNPRPKNLSRQTTNRLPPPALFQGPPSKNASHISLVPLPSRDQPNASTKDSEPPARRRSPRPSRIPPAASFSGPSIRPSAGQSQRAAQNDDFRAETLWAEMQKTLADVELSAMGGSHVFSEGHTKALEQLRTAQLALAQSWARSEENEMDTEGDNDDEDMQKALGLDKDGKMESRFKDRKNLEEETERDIRLARRRRERNDQYFQRVNAGVLDVVGKLDEVAGAMRRVEKESREIWSESTGSDSEGEKELETDATGLTDSPVSRRVEDRV